MPAGGNNQRRARAERSVSTEGTEEHQDALASISDGLNDIILTLTKKAKEGDVQAAKALIELNKEEFTRARSGANDPLLIRIAEIREAGSKIEEELWAKLYKNVPTTMEIPLVI